MSRRILNNKVSAVDPLLLDDYPALAAYSFRLLRRDYTGDCITVRRTSNGDTASIGFLSGVLDINGMVSWVGSSNSYITGFFDQMENGFDLSQSNPDHQPRNVTNGVAITNNGTVALNNTLASSGGGYLESATTVDESSLSMVTVGQNANTSTTSRIFGVRGIVSKGTFAQANDNSLRFDGAAQTGSITATSPNDFIRFSQKTNTQVKDWINNVSNIDSSISLVNSYGYINMGATITALSDNFDTYIHEGIIWDSDQTANRTAIQTDLNDYYSVY